MDSRTVTFTHERSNAIPIKSLCNNKYHSYDISYDLKSNFFDPSKSSPPNEFLLKLNQRIQIYESLEKKTFNFTKT
uniref:Uncharacterized protein n=1 Tax=viral metagenome TaxID=1070528 RepID=A0A6C0D8B4_9ZZZZ